MKFYCTLFDSAYLSRGLALHSSLIRHCQPFHLYIFAFDDLCYKILMKLKPEHATVIGMQEWEDEDLLRIKAGRTRAEYCWTSTSSTILYCITRFQLNHCTYLDADLYFYSSPEPVFQELVSASVGITEHFYTPRYDQSATSGKYCVQFVYFRNDEEGLKVLNWWRAACIDWCFARLENGKYGDQKYLDSWTEMFENVHVIRNRGVGLAPWNIQKYTLLPDYQYLLPGMKSSQKVIFYHFHHLRFAVKNERVVVEYSKFEISRHILDEIYEPYLQQLGTLESSRTGKVFPADGEVFFKKQPLFYSVYLQLRLLLKPFRAVQYLYNLVKR